MRHPAKSILKRKLVLADGAILQFVVWELPLPLPGSSHRYKYRLYYGRNGQNFVRFDNERGKGDHRHCRDQEEPYQFRDLDTLFQDFLSDVKRHG